MLFEDKHYGHPISEKLRKALMRNTDVKDHREVAKIMEIQKSSVKSIHTIRNIVYLQGNLKYENAKMIIVLTRLACRNSMIKRAEGLDDEDYLLDELDQTKDELIASLEEAMQIEPLNEEL